MIKYYLFTTIFLLTPSAFSKAKKIQDLTGEIRTWVREKVAAEKVAGLPKSTTFEIDLTLNSLIEDEIKTILSRYKTDYSSVVIIDNQNGNILAAIDYYGRKRRFDRELSFRSSHPAASLVKILTAAELLENKTIAPDHEFKFKGKSTTLYKYQLRKAQGKWKRTQSFEKAFALSNNVVFGKAAINNIHSLSFYKRARKFGFNRPLLPEVTLEPSFFSYPESQYNLAEIASGLNRQTRLSPIHATLLASVVANDGYLNSPRLLAGIHRTDNNTQIWAGETLGWEVMSSDSAKALSHMMNQTMVKGTARSAFKKFVRKYQEDWEFGGKTGSITGGEPFGKRDWFVAYLKPKNHSDSNYPKGISIGIMNINQKKWYVKAPYLSERILGKLIKKNLL